METHQTSSTCEQSNLSWLWKQPCHPREIFFLWQTYKNGLPTNAKFFKANCIGNDLWPLCQQDQETHLHALRDCANVKRIWNTLNPPQHFYDKNLQDWIQQNYSITNESSLNLPWNTIFTYAIRSIWLNRNKKKYSRILPSQTIKFEQTFSTPLKLTSILSLPLPKFRY